MPDLARIAVSGVLVAVIAVFGTLTWQQSGIYRDEITFYRHIISLSPEAQTIHRNLSKVLNDAGRPEEALAASRIEVERFPDSALAHNTHGVALLALNRLDEAGESFRRALKLDPDRRNARQNMAETRRGQGRFVESLRWYGSVLEIDPEFAPAHAGMGAALFHLESVQKVGGVVGESSVSCVPTCCLISALRLLGDAYRRQHRYGEAIEAYRGILETDHAVRSRPRGNRVRDAAVQALTSEALESLARANCYSTGVCRRRGSSCRDGAGL